MKCLKLIELLTAQGQTKQDIAGRIGISTSELDHCMLIDHMQTEKVLILAQVLQQNAPKIQTNYQQNGPIFSGDNNGSFINNLYQIILNDQPIPEQFQDKIQRMQQAIDLLTQTNSQLTSMLEIQKLYYEQKIENLNKNQSN